MLMETATERAMQPVESALYEQPGVVASPESTVIVLPTASSGGKPVQAADVHRSALAALSTFGHISSWFVAPLLGACCGAAPPLIVEFANPVAALQALQQLQAAPNVWFSVHPFNGMRASESLQLATDALASSTRSSAEAVESLGLTSHVTTPKELPLPPGSMPPPPPPCGMGHLTGHPDLASMVASFEAMPRGPPTGSAGVFLNSSAGARQAQNTLQTPLAHHDGGVAAGGEKPQRQRTRRQKQKARQEDTEARCEFSRAEALRGGPHARCTLMLRDIPCRWEISELLAAIEPHSADSWDLIYLPSKSLEAANAGYAFVNLRTSFDAMRLHDALHGRPWPRTRSRKVCDVRYARLQGAQLMQHLLSAVRDTQRAARGYLAIRGPDGQVRIRTPAPDPRRSTKLTGDEGVPSIRAPPSAPPMLAPTGNVPPAALNDTLQGILSRLTLSPVAAAGASASDGAASVQPPTMAAPAGQSWEGSSHSVPDCALGGSFGASTYAPATPAPYAPWGVGGSTSASNIMFQAQREAEGQPQGAEWPTAASQCVPAVSAPEGLDRGTLPRQLLR